MKTKQIFIQYWILATRGLSEMKLWRFLLAYTCVGARNRVRDIRKDFALEGKGEGDDEEHEQGHLQHQEHKHLSSVSKERPPLGRASVVGKHTRV